MEANDHDELLEKIQEVINIATDHNHLRMKEWAKLYNDINYEFSRLNLELDEYGVPLKTYSDGSSAIACPPNPCTHCTGDSSIPKKNSFLSSWEWCQMMKTCGATVDWDKVYGHE